MLEFVCLPWSEVCSARVTSLLLLLLFMPFDAAAAADDDDDDDKAGLSKAYLPDLITLITKIIVVTHELVTLEGGGQTVLVRLSGVLGSCLFLSFLCLCLHFIYIGGRPSFGSHNEWGCAHTHTYTRAHTRTHAHTNTHTCTHAHTHTHTHTCTHMHTHGEC